MDERTIDIITPCKICTFAKFEDNKQVGCEIGRLETFKKRLKVKYTGNQEKEWYEIQTVCNTWTDRKVEAKEVLDFVRIKYDSLIVSIHQDNVFENIKQRIHELNDSAIKPQNIIIIVKNFEISYNDLHAMVKKESKMPYTIVRIVDGSLDTLRCIDYGINHVKSSYYLVVVDNEELDDKLVDRVNERINVELIPCLLACKKHKMHGMVVSTPAHKQFGGNRAMPIEEKLIETATYQNNPDYVIVYDS